MVGKAGSVIGEDSVRNGRTGEQANEKEGTWGAPNRLIA